MKRILVILFVLIGMNAGYAGNEDIFPDMSKDFDMGSTTYKDRIQGYEKLPNGIGGDGFTCPFCKKYTFRLITECYDVQNYSSNAISEKNTYLDGIVAGTCVFYCKKCKNKFKSKYKTRAGGTSGIWRDGNENK